MKEAPRAWYERLTNFLIEKGYKKGDLIKLSSSGTSIHVYVDDIVFGSTSPSKMQEFINKMGHEFKISMVGELNFFVGL